jgi:hypothetical protein
MEEIGDLALLKVGEAGADLYTSLQTALETCLLRIKTTNFRTYDHKSSSPGLHGMPSQFPTVLGRDGPRALRLHSSALFS